MLPPGLRGFVAAQQQGQQQQSQELAMLSQLAQLRGAEEDRGMKRQLLPLQIQEHEAKVKKMQQETALNEQLGPLLSNPNITPDILDALGTKLAMGGHPGAATVMNIADKRRKLAEQQTAVSGMKATPGVMPATPNDDEGNPMPVVQGTPGVTAFLHDSPYVGPAAKQLQSSIDSGAARDPEVIQKHLDRLTQMHSSREQNQATQDAILARQREGREQGQANRIEIRNMYPPVGRGGISGASDEGRMTEDAIKDQARLSLKDPGAIRELGRLNPADKAKVLNERSRMMKDAGITPEDIVAGRAFAKANQNTLNKLQTQTKAIETFENTAIRNGEMLVTLAEKIDSTGIPILEKPLRAIQAQTGNAEVAKFNAQLNLFRAEAAKILTNPNLTGVLTDTARKEMAEVISGGASAKQVKGVVALLKQDFENRRMENAITVKSLMDDLRSPSGQATPTAPTPAPASGGWSIVR